jgi:uncharacterized protein (DUF983 family)
MSAADHPDHVPTSQTVLHESVVTTPIEGIWRRLGGAIWAILRQRCPRCRKGKIFRGRFAMNDPCPVCELIFQREEGYFLGAMYVSYLLATMIVVPSYYLAGWLFPHWNGSLVALVALLPYLPLIPVVFRYSRVIWIYFERGSDSYGMVNAGPYEKERLRQLIKEKAGPKKSESSEGTDQEPPPGPAAPGAEEDRQDRDNGRRGC